MTLIVASRTIGTAPRFLHGAVTHPIDAALAEAKRAGGCDVGLLALSVAFALTFARNCFAIGVALWLAFSGQTLNEQQFKTLRIEGLIEIAHL